MTETTDPPALRFVGQRVQRSEDARFLTGRGRYVDDVKLPGMLHAAFLRSSYPHAKIKNINTSRAEALPGVFAVYTGEVLQAKLAAPMVVPGRSPHTKTTRTFPLAVGKVRYVGDPVAVVIAANRYLAEDAAELIEVDYDPLPVVVDMEKALEPNAPLVDEEMGDNIIEHVERSFGDVAGAFSSADKVVSTVFRQHRQTNVPMETRGCLAHWDVARKMLDLYLSTQMPHSVRDILVNLLGLPAHTIRVVAPDVGGGFGQKGAIYPEEIVTCLATRELGRPVKWIEDRRENLMASNHAREEICHLDVALKKDGTLLGMKAKYLGDAGAYPILPFGPTIVSGFAATLIPGHWKFANYAYEAYVVVTNKCALAPYRAPWMMSSVVNEGIIEVIAQELGMDSIEVRRKNIIRQEDQPYQSPTGFHFAFVSVDKTLEKALEMVGYPHFREEQEKARKQGRYLGLGVATFIEPGAIGTQMYAAMGIAGAAWDSATVRVEPGGQVTVMVGISSHGQSHETTMAQIVAEELGVRLEDVVILHGDTARDPYGPGTYGSRSAVAGGGATLNAARTVREKAFRIAGHMLEAAPEDLELRGEGQIGVKGVPDRGTTLAEIVRMVHFDILKLPEGEEPGLEATGRYDPPPLSFSNATHACLVEVDIETGQVKINKYVAVEDCGTMLNPLVVEGQVLGGIAQGIGGVLFEHVAYDEHGQFLTGTFMDYLLPTATEMPRVALEHIETPSPYTPYGAKPVGEGGVLGSAPAVLNAIADALAPLGVRVTGQPLGPSQIRDLLRQAGH